MASHSRPSGPGKFDGRIIHSTATTWQILRSFKLVENRTLEMATEKRKVLAGGSIFLWCYLTARPAGACDRNRCVHQEGVLASWSTTSSSYTFISLLL